LLPGLALVLAIVFASPAHAATQVQARLSAGTVETGAGVTLTVTVTDPAGGTGDPQFTLPPGLSQLGSEQGQNFSWVNGRSSTIVEYRFALGTDQPGRYEVGPIRVRVGRTVYECPSMALNVTASAPRTARAGRSVAGASYVSEVKPTRPYVGQLVQLTIRLVQTQTLNQTGGNATPSTTGFWSESYGDPIEYRALAGGRPAWVTERRSRIYPLAPGRAVIGSASLLVIPSSGNVDPLFGGPSPQPVEVVSDSVPVQVQPLPPGAPPGFVNAVGALAFSWGLDRGHTTQDQALTLSLDARGAGNLPLLRTPPLELPDFEVYTGTVEDSLAPLGELTPGRRRFQWTLVPKRTGTLHLAPPAIAWFDPAAGAYRSASLPVLSVEVLASGPGQGRGEDAGTLPGALAREPARPGGRRALAWVLALGGALLGLAVRLWRRAAVPDARAGERARQQELLAAAQRTRGPEFWTVADAASEWAERRGRPVLRLREDIAAARYGGMKLPEEDVRRRIVERLSEVAPEAPSALPVRALAVVVGLLAVASWFVGTGARGPEVLAVRARAADALAGQRQVSAAASAWAQLWKESPGNPDLAARLAWAALREPRLPEASLWVLRGRTGEPRSAALAWSEERVREAGGLVGAPGAGLPVRSIEWAALAFALALGALLEWPRRWSSAALMVLALLAAFAPELQRLGTRTDSLAVIGAETTLQGADTQLEPGEVVRVVASDTRGVRVAAGHDVAGVVPEGSLLRVHEDAR
jgi:hypothetical protein